MSTGEAISQDIEMLQRIPRVVLLSNGLIGMTEVWPPGKFRRKSVQSLKRRLRWLIWQLNEEVVVDGEPALQARLW